MVIGELNLNVELDQTFTKFRRLLDELREKDLPHFIIKEVNTDIQELNTIISSETEIRILIQQKQRKIIKLLKNNLGIVPKHYYRKRYLVLGLVWGLPVGALIAVSLNNMAYLGIGLPLGLIIGFAIGINLDNNAKLKNRQLNVEI